MHKRLKAIACTLAAVASGGALAVSASADPVADFYKGKTLRVIVGTAPGGGYDLYARLFADNIVRHIPGNPTAIVTNMPGAGQFRAARYAYQVAPRDGTVFLVIVQTVAVDTALGSPTGVKADEYSWIGRLTSNVSAATVWHTAGVKTIEDVRRSEVIAGATGERDLNTIVSRLLNAYAGTKFRIVSGYAGASAIYLAMERGEVQSFLGSWSGLKASKSNYLSENKVSVIYQMALQRHPELQTVPTSSNSANRTKAAQRSDSSPAAPTSAVRWSALRACPPSASQPCAPRSTP